MNIKVKMLKTVVGVDRDYEEGQEYTFDETVAKSLIANGKAVEVKENEVVSAFTGLLASIKTVVSEGINEASDKIVDKNKKSQHGPVYQNSFTSPDPELNGHAVFNSTGGFLHAVTQIASTNPSEDSVRKMGDWRELQRKAGLGLGGEAKGLGQPSGNYEASDPDGGVLVIPEFANSIYERMQLEENFLRDANNIVVRGNTLSLPALDDYSRTDGNRWGAVLGAWANEAEQLSNVSKAKWRAMDLRLKKLYIFAYLTDELLSDSPYALEQYIGRLAGKELAFKINDAMIRGTGAGMPLGILNAPATISVAKETGQAAATIMLANIENMWMRLNYYYRKNAVWLINQDCEKQLQLMSFPVGVAGVPIYQPQGGVANPAYATLKGRPVKIVEFCETLGTVGDIILTNWEGYQAITKGGIKSDVSMHVRFLYGEMAYRFTYRMDGQPLWDKALTPYKGTTTTSTSITLATRA